MMQLGLLRLGRPFCRFKNGLTTLGGTPLPGTGSFPLDSLTTFYPGITLNLIPFCNRQGGGASAWRGKLCAQYCIAACTHPSVRVMCLL